MKKNKFIMIFKRAAFPAIMTTISFMLFLLIYWFVIATAIEPYYFQGLIFEIPFVCFGIITFFTVKGKLKIGAACVMTTFFAVVLSVLMLFTFVDIVLDAATTTTNNINRYKKCLKAMGYPNSPIIKYVPRKIPSGAKNIFFSYHPAFMQGGENLELKFEMDSASIDNYINEFSQKAKWIGKSSDSAAGVNGISSNEFDVFGYANLPADFTIYLMYNKSYKPYNWNHGELSLVAISKQRSEIIFHVEDW